MKQTLYPTSYLFIPEPIERQLGVYGLGELLEVYKRGWDKHNNWLPKLRMLLIGLVLLVAAVVSFNIISYSEDTTSVIPVGLFIFPTVAVCWLIITVPMLFQPTLCVGAFSNGFVYARNKQVTVLTWSEISLLERKTKKGMDGRPLLLLIIHTHDGRIFRLKASYIQLDDLGKIIQEHIA
jgi:hypothetical protein